MKKKASTIIAVSMLLGILMYSAPPASADVYVPPGPWPSMDAWISPTLFVLEGYTPIGWVYSDGPMYVAPTSGASSLKGVPTALGEFIPEQGWLDKIHKTNPAVPWGIGRTDIPFSSEVMVFGFIPGVMVAPDQVPPPVEITITWNGIPYVVTLTLPDTQVVGNEYPHKLYPDIQVPYAFTYPYEDPDGTPNAPWKNAHYNIWFGDPNDILSLPYDFPYGYYFWYVFHPNVGDWIAYNSNGETKHPPTYDITALFEYETSQIWFNHVAFDVSFLEVHKMIDWESGLPWPLSNKIKELIIIKNVGNVNATRLDVMQTFPADIKHGVYPPEKAYVRIYGDRNLGDWLTIEGLPESPWKLPPPYDYLNPGETMEILMTLELFNYDDWSGSIVFDGYVSAWEIPPWKYPIMMHSIFVGVPDGIPQFEFPSLVDPDIGGDWLWWGWKLLDRGGYWTFEFIPEWWVDGPWLRDPIPQGRPQMILDPDPIDLNNDGVINAEDLSLVRQAIIGLIPYDTAMDLNVNGKVDTFDLARYKLAAE